MAISPNLLFAGASALGGLFGAKSQANAQEESNRLAREQVEMERERIAPLLAGSKDVLNAGLYVDPLTGNTISQEEFDALDDAGKESYRWMSQFEQPVSAIQKVGSQASDISKGYLDETGAYQGAGLEGLEGIRRLAIDDPTGQRDALSEKYRQRYLEGTQAELDSTLDEIARKSGFDSRKTALSGNRFDALSSQRARMQAAIKGAMAKNVADAVAQRGREALAYGDQTASNEQARQTGLLQTMYGAGAQGLNLASSATQLGTGAAEKAMTAPFLPYSTYARTTSGATLPTANIQPVANPFAAAVGAGTAAYGATQGYGGQ